MSSQLFQNAKLLCPSAYRNKVARFIIDNILHLKNHFYFPWLGLRHARNFVIPVYHQTIN